MAIAKRDKKGKILAVDNSHLKGLHLGWKPQKMTPEVVNRLDYAFAIGATTTEACSYAKISRQTFYEFLKKFPEYSDRIADLKNTPVLKARMTIHRALEQPLWAFKYLEKKRRREFGDGSNVDTNGKPLPIDGVVVNNNNLTFILENAKPEDREKFIEITRKLLASQPKPEGDALSL